MSVREYPFPWQFVPGNYSELYLMRRVTEAQVQSDVIELLHAYDVDAVPIDAGGRRQRGRMAAAARAAGFSLGDVLNVKTGRAIPGGFADLEATLAPAGQALYIEVKAPVWWDEKKRSVRRAGEPSIEQLEFLMSKYRRGAAVLVAWAAQDVEAAYGSLIRMNRRMLR